MAAAGSAYWLRARGDSGDVTAFFTLPTPRVCEAGVLAITASDGHFAAFTDGRVLAESGDKFLVATVTLRNGGSTAVPVSEDDFYLTERPGKEHPPAALADAATKLAASLEPGASLSGLLAFSVPPSVGAAKLVYDDGCIHQEWLVP